MNLTADFRKHPCRIPQSIPAAAGSLRSVARDVFIPAEKKAAAQPETHQRLISVAVIDQLNSASPHNFLAALSCFKALRLHVTESNWGVVLSLLQSTGHTGPLLQHGNHLLAFVFPSYSAAGSWRSGCSPDARIIEILHLISKVSLPRSALPARIYNRLTLNVMQFLGFCRHYPCRKITLSHPLWFVRAHVFLHWLNIPNMQNMVCLCDPNIASGIHQNLIRGWL